MMMMMMNSQRLTRHTHCVVVQPHTTTAIPTQMRKNAVVSGVHGSIKSDVPGLVQRQNLLSYPIHQKAMPVPPQLPLPFYHHHHHHRRQQQQQQQLLDLSILSMSLLDDDNQPPMVLENNTSSSVITTAQKEEEEEEYSDVTDLLLLCDQDFELFANLMLEEENDGQNTVDNNNNNNIIVEEEEEEEINLIPTKVEEDDDEPTFAAAAAAAAALVASHCESSPNRGTSSKNHKLSTTHKTANNNEAEVVVGEVTSGTENGVGGAATPTPVRLRAAHLEQWEQRCQELIQFQHAHGHVLVPLQYPANPCLSHWIKRQRCQYKLKTEGKHSTLTDERQALLDNLGFVWDSHCASWDSRLDELLEFGRVQGHYIVPTVYPENPPLAAWIKVR
jgi:hypothetical protein